MKMLFNILILSCNLVASKIIAKKWILEQAPLDGSNFPGKIVTINKQFPGPNVECNSGDTLVIEVDNKSERDITIHWHGITQKNTSNMDGIPYISQLPISPNSSFEYTFNVQDQTGTYWYHAHTGLDAEFIFGSIIIHDLPEVWSDIVKFNNNYNYDKEENDDNLYGKVILISELWRKNHNEILKELTEMPFKFLGYSNHVLINGKYMKNDTSIFKVKPSKKYRFRVIGANGFSIMSFKIKNHKFTVIELDGTLIDPIKVDYLLINSGQRYSIILETDQIPADYSIIVQKYSLNGLAEPYGEAILSYENTKTNEFIKLVRIDQTLNRWIIPEISTSKWYLTQKNRHYYLPPNEVNQDIVFNIKEIRRNGLLEFTINNDTLKPSEFHKFLSSENHPRIYKLKLGQSIQFVFQEIVSADEICFQHPWHLHGHSFHIVDHGPGFYNTENDLKLINQKLSNYAYLPIFRDTFTHFPEETPVKYKEYIQEKINKRSDKPEIKSCGWTAIRFIADNPGKWLMHCHVTAHLVMGKVFVIETTN